MVCRGRWCVEQWIAGREDGREILQLSVAVDVDGSEFVVSLVLDIQNMMF